MIDPTKPDGEVQLHSTERPDEAAGILDGLGELLATKRLERTDPTASLAKRLEDLACQSESYTVCDHGRFLHADVPPVMMKLATELKALSTPTVALVEVAKALVSAPRYALRISRHIEAVRVVLAALDEPVPESTDGLAALNRRPVKEIAAEVCGCGLCFDVIERVSTPICRGQRIADALQVERDALREREGSK